jgi:hypothetical protein
MNESVPAHKDDVYDLKVRLDNTEIAIGLILAELSKQLDSKRALEDAHLKAQTTIYPRQIVQIIDKIKNAMNTSLVAK